MVWGGRFGKVPRSLVGLQSNMTKVAVGNGFGGAISSDFEVFGFYNDHGTDVVQEITVEGKPKHVEVMESTHEMVLLDSKGRVYSSTLAESGGFAPAKQLEGALKRMNIVHLKCGKEHCAAVSDKGRVITWGNTNGFGQLGTQEPTGEEKIDPRTPRFVRFPGDVPIIDVACGDRHTVFLDGTGNLYSVGCDRWAQLGVSAEPWLKDHESFARVVQKASLLRGLAGAEVACGGQHSVMLVKDGTVFSFGFNQWGQLGHHNYSSFGPPSPIAQYHIKAISIRAGENHTCLVTDHGELMCLGSNEYGQLGNGTLQSSMKWKKVKAQKRVIKPLYLYSSGCTTAVVVEKDEHGDRKTIEVAPK
ncbi:chromosome condensation regulator RCC1 [Gracilaria domingensis]|nr:chromosome condensation regulator RCC1 [Gracilaria domingensis]